MYFRSARHLRPYIIAVLVATALIVPVSLFMVIRVEEESMEPTLVDGQWILVLRGSGRVESGDIAVFISPADRNLAVKRCVMVEGDRPIVSHGWLETSWGRWYLTGPQWDELESLKIIPEGSFYMVGDNQFHSMDSRSYGSVSRNELVGKVLMPSGRRKNG